MTEMISTELINMPLSVRGVKIGIVIKQDIEPKSYKISVRTNDEYAGKRNLQPFSAEADICAPPERGYTQTALKRLCKEHSELSAEKQI